MTKILFILLFVFSCYAQKASNWSDKTINFPDSLDDSTSVLYADPGDVINSSDLNKILRMIRVIQDKIGVIGSDSLLSNSEISDSLSTYNLNDTWDSIAVVSNIITFYIGSTAYPLFANTVPSLFSTSPTITRIAPDTLKLSWLPGEITETDVDSIIFILSWAYDAGVTPTSIEIPWSTASADSDTTFPIQYLTFSDGGDTSDYIIKQTILTDVYSARDSMVLDSTFHFIYTDTAMYVDSLTFNGTYSNFEFRAWPNMWLAGAKNTPKYGTNADVQFIGKSSSYGTFTNTKSYTITNLLSDSTVFLTVSPDTSVLSSGDTLWVNATLRHNWGTDNVWNSATKASGDSINWPWP